MATSSLPTGVPGDLLVQVRDSYASRYPGASRKTIEHRARRVVTDAVVLARAAKSRQLVTYEQTQLLRGDGAGAAMNGNWLDDVHDYVLAPNALPDATMLVVNGSTGRPNQDAFVEGRTRRSRIPLNEVPAEQQLVFERAIELEQVLGIVVGSLARRVMVGSRYRKTWKGGPVTRPALMSADALAAFEQDVQKALDRARARVAQEGKVLRRVGRAYDGSINLDDPVAWRNCAIELMARSDRCALTGARIVPGDPHDGASIDRIDNRLGYFLKNFQLVTRVSG